MEKTNIKTLVIIILCIALVISFWLITLKLNLQQGLSANVRNGLTFEELRNEIGNILNKSPLTSDNPEGSGQTTDDKEINEFAEKLAEGLAAQETQDWQTYTNEGYGFEIKYPNGFEIKEDVGYFSPSDPSQGEISYVEISDSNVSINIYKSKVTYETEKNDLDFAIKGDFENIIINGVSGVKKIGEATEHIAPNCVRELVMILDKDGLPLVFRSCSPDNQDINQILSTFEFLE